MSVLQFCAGRNFHFSSYFSEITKDVKCGIRRKRICCSTLKLFPKLRFIVLNKKFLRLRQGASRWTPSWINSAEFLEFWLEPAESIFGLGYKYTIILIMEEKIQFTIATIMMKYLVANFSRYVEDINIKDVKILLSHIKETLDE